MKKNMIIFAGFALLIYIYTFGLFNTYFQQDEWNGFGVVISLSHKSFFSWFDILGAYHIIPLSQFFWYLLYKIFGLNATFFALTAFVLHVTASFLVYKFTRKLSNNELVGVLSAVLFATNARAGDAFTHLAIFPATLTCFVVMMLFFLYLAKFKEQNIISFKDSFILISLFLISIVLREDSFMIMPLLVGFFLIYNRKVFSRKNKYFFISFFSVISAVVGIRLFISANSTSNLTFTDNFYQMYFYHLVTFPFKLIIQSFVEVYNIYSLVSENIHRLYPVEIPRQILDTLFMDFIFLQIISAIIILFIFLTYKIKDSLFWKNVMFGLLWLLVNAGLLAGVGRYLYFIEPRYLYHASFVVNFIFALIFVYVLQSKTGNTNLRNIRKIMVIIIAAFLLITSFQELQHKLQMWQKQGEARKNIITSLLKEHPSIPKNTIFFVQCKSTCHRNSEFGLPNEIVLPFTSGPGWIFMLLYAQSDEDAYASFFNKVDGKEFLWDYGAEGYKKIGEYSFGYFVNKNLLKQTIKNNKLNKEIVIGLEYDEENFTLHDISEKIQKEL